MYVYQSFHGLCKIWSAASESHQDVWCVGGGHHGKIPLNCSSEIHQMGNCFFSESAPMIIYFLYTFFRELLLQHRVGRDGISYDKVLKLSQNDHLFYFANRKIIIIKIQSSEHLHVSLSSKSRLKITTWGEKFSCASVFLHGEFRS